MGPKSPADLLGDWLETVDLAHPDDDGRDVEPDGLGQAAAIIHFLRPYADGQEQPDAATAANIAEAYDLLFEMAHQQRRAINITKAWCGALKDGKAPTFNALVTALHSVDHDIPKRVKLSKDFVDKVLKPKTRPVSPFTILATIAGPFGALGVNPDAKVKSAGAYLQQNANPAVRSKKNEKQNGRRSKAKTKNARASKKVLKRKSR